MDDKRTQIAVIVGRDGTSNVCVGFLDDVQGRTTDVLPYLVAQGWRIVSTTAFGGSPGSSPPFGTGHGSEGPAVFVVLEKPKRLNPE